MGHPLHQLLSFVVLAGCQPLPAWDSAWHLESLPNSVLQQLPLARHIYLFKVKTQKLGHNLQSHRNHSGSFVTEPECSLRQGNRAEWYGEGMELAHTKWQFHTVLFPVSYY